MLNRWPIQSTFCHKLTPDDTYKRFKLCRSSKVPTSRQAILLEFNKLSKERSSILLTVKAIIINIEKLTYSSCSERNPRKSFGVTSWMRLPYSTLQYTARHNCINSHKSISASSVRTYNDVKMSRPVNASAAMSTILLLLTSLRRNTTKSTLAYRSIKTGCGKEKKPHIFFKYL